MALKNIIIHLYFSNDFSEVLSEFYRCMRGAHVHPQFRKNQSRKNKIDSQDSTCNYLHQIGESNWTFSHIMQESTEFYRCITLPLLKKNKQEYLTGIYCLIYEGLTSVYVSNCNYRMIFYNIWLKFFPFQWCYHYFHFLNAHNSDSTQQNKY